MSFPAKNQHIEIAMCDNSQLTMILAENPPPSTTHKGPFY